jgi:hypothetical protein
MNIDMYIYIHTSYSSFPHWLFSSGSPNDGDDDNDDNNNDDNGDGDNDNDIMITAFIIRTFLTAPNLVLIISKQPELGFSELNICDFDGFWQILRSENLSSGYFEKYQN